METTYCLTLLVRVRSEYGTTRAKGIVMTIDAKLTSAFVDLRSRGYFARKNWQCCMSCGYEAIPDHYTKAVFYHAQDAARLKATGEVCLAWDGDGAEIVDCLERAGLAVSWNGKKETRIKVSDATSH